MPESCPPTLAAARARLAGVEPDAYARSRNALDGAVSGLSPYITHGLLSLDDALRGVSAWRQLPVNHRWVQELGWRAFFRHVWHHRGDGILSSLHGGPLPDAAYANRLPDDIREGRTGVPVIDRAVYTLYTTGTLHNHARMWLASYMVHLRKLHWRVGADWLYSHLLDGDLASNHLSWQWVAGTGSHKPYLFNNDNVLRYAPAAWHSPGSVVDTSYEALDQLARRADAVGPENSTEADRGCPVPEPAVTDLPPAAVHRDSPDPALVRGRDVWLVHPWSLGEAAPGLGGQTLKIGLLVADFHRALPWSTRRWQFVGSRMAELSDHCWYGDAAAVGAALAGARSVRSVAEPHLAAWLPGWAQCQAGPGLFPPVEPRCDSFSRWWTRSTRGLTTAGDLLDRAEQAAALT